MRGLALAAGLAAVTFAGTALAQAPERQLGAHVHGESHLDIAVDGDTVAMALHAPGADIVRFEHEPGSDAERAAVAAAIATLGNPLDLFRFPAAAGCSVVSASAEMVEEEHHDDAPAAGAAEEHHAEFSAAYEIRCTDIQAARLLTFPFFDAFPNAEMVEVQMVGPRGQTGGDVGRSDAGLDLSGAL